MKIKLALFFYCILLLIFSAFSFLFIDPNLVYLKPIFSDFFYLHRVFTTIIYCWMIVLFFCFYFFFLYLLITKQFTKKNVIQLIVAIAIFLLFSYPAMVSFDVFNYIATAKVLFHYHENPYIIMPIEFTGDPLLLFMHAANKTALYGFVWVLMTGIPYALGMGNFLFTLFNFKLLALGFYFAAIYTIWKISKNILSVYLFALNPLVIIETLVSSHNDIVLVCFMLFSYYLLQKRKIFLSLLFLFASIWIKFATLFLVPIYVYALILILREKKINWNTLFVYSALSMMFVFFFIAPIREEIYPWYALWFFSFAILIPEKKFLLWFSIALTFGLLFRYVPFMLLGTYFGPTPLIKIIVTTVPPLVICMYFFYRKFLCKRPILR